MSNSIPEGLEGGSGMVPCSDELGRKRDGGDLRPEETVSKIGKGGKTLCRGGEGR